MKLAELLAKIEPDTRMVIEYDLRTFPYKAEELYEDSLFFEEIKDFEVKSIWYSKCAYQAIVIELEK